MDSRCPACVQALEWGRSYLFKSCAMVNVTSAADSCNGCSGRGTCAANATCTCNSSPSTGFFYGGHCEYENECETDAHCGVRGKCLAIGDDSGPKMQCFCEAGAFGNAVASATGLERRVCDSASALTLNTSNLVAFGSEHKNMKESPGKTFKVWWTVSESSIEVAMKANTTSWIALGWRSVECAHSSACSLHVCYKQRCNMAVHSGKRQGAHSTCLCPWRALPGADKLR